MGFSTGMMTGLLGANAAMGAVRAQQSSVSALQSRRQILEGYAASGQGDAEGAKAELEQVQTQSAKAQAMLSDAVNETNRNLGAGGVAQKDKAGATGEAKREDEAREEKADAPSGPAGEKLSAGAQFVHADPATDLKAGIYELRQADGGRKVSFTRPDASAEAPSAKPGAASATEPASVADDEQNEAGRPSRAKAAAEPKKADKPEEGSGDGKKEQKTTINTDRVDQEIRDAKKKVQNLKNGARSARTPEEKGAAERELANAEREVARKDNDSYRKQHATVTTQQA